MAGERESRISSDDLAAACDRAAWRWDVRPEIHPDDPIFRSLLENPVFESPQSAIDYYFADGALSARKLLDLLSEHGAANGERFRLLELGAGYGAVTRHIRHVMPLCELTASDIRPEAVKFIAGALGTRAVRADPHLEELRAEQAFDVVFALSFLTHVPKRAFPSWLAGLGSLVKPGGLLIFTTHGLESRTLFPQCQLDSEGYYFHSSDEKSDLGAGGYGWAVVSPGYVLNRALDTPGLALKAFSEAHWWKHQDVYVAKALGVDAPAAGTSAWPKRLFGRWRA